MYQPDLQNGLLQVGKMAEALVRLQQGADSVLPSADVNRQTTDDDRRLSYDEQLSSCIDFSHNRQMAVSSAAPTSACAGGAVDGGNQSLFVVIARSEYDAMRQELAGLKQALSELKSSVDYEIKQLRADSRMFKQHIGGCACGVWQNRSYIGNGSHPEQAGVCSPTSPVAAGHTGFSSGYAEGFSAGLPANMFASSDMADGTDHGKLVQLLPNYDVWVNKMNLQIVINEAPSRKEGAVLFVLRRVIPLVFAWEELACSRGQGLNCKTTDDMFSKVPLDPTKVAACKAYMRKFCIDNNYREPTERAINQTFSHQVNYARRRLKVTGNPHSYLSPVKPKKLSSTVHHLSPDHVEKDCFKTEPYSQGFVQQDL